MIVLRPGLPHDVLRGLRGGDTCWLDVSDDNVALHIFYGLNKISKLIFVGLNFHFHFHHEELMLLGFSQTFACSVRILMPSFASKRVVQMALMPLGQIATRSDMLLQDVGSLLV